MISEDGKGPDSKLVVETEPADDQLIKAQRKGKTETFEMDFVFSAESTQEDVFKQARDVIVSCIDGYNVCIFTYGQTGSGKTFTMDGPDDNPGLNRRALGELFNVRIACDVHACVLNSHTICRLLLKSRKTGHMRLKSACLRFTTRRSTICLLINQSLEALMYVLLLLVY